MRLLYYANGARYKVNGEWVFRKWFTVPSKDLIQSVGVPRKSMYKIRDELVKANYIRFKPGIGSGATEYMICAIANGEKQQSSAPCPRPKGTPSAPAQGSFDLDEFWEASLRNAFGDDL